MHESYPDRAIIFRYSSLPLWEIKKIPVPELACDKALVVVWVTNKQKYRKFVIEELFPSWSCTFIGEWYWVKVMQFLGKSNPKLKC